MAASLIARFAFSLLALSLSLGLQAQGGALATACGAAAAPLPSLSAPWSCADRPVERVVSSPEEYLRVLKAGRSGARQEKVRVEGLVARVLKGKSEKDFEKLSDDPARQLVFLMGSDGLEQLVGLSNDEILVRIGYKKEYISKLKNEGYRFRIVVFKAEGEAGKPATWDNVVELVSRLYPRVEGKLRAALPALKAQDFETIQGQAPSNYSLVDRAGPAHPDFIDEERLARSEGKPWEVRGFLFYRARLMDLYSGDGYTHDEQGRRGLREYITPNRRLKELPAAASADL